MLLLCWFCFFLSFCILFSSGRDWIQIPSAITLLLSPYWYIPLQLALAYVLPMARVVLLHTHILYCHVLTLHRACPVSLTTSFLMHCFRFCALTDLEHRIYPVQPRERRQPSRPPQQAHRHRHGLWAPCLHPAGKNVLIYFISCDAIWYCIIWYVLSVHFLILYRLIWSDVI